MAHAFLDRPIDVYTCQNDPEQPAIALIRGCRHMIFRAPNAWKARQKAETWRREAVAGQRHLTKGQRERILEDLEE